MSENSKNLEEAKDSGEQSINNYLMFQKYSEMIEKELETFTKKENISSEIFYEACNFAKEENIECNFLDYILSSIEFEQFYYLMLDYKKMGTNEVNLDKINSIENK